MSAFINVVTFFFTRLVQSGHLVLVAHLSDNDDNNSVCLHHFNFGLFCLQSTTEL